MANQAAIVRRVAEEVFAEKGTRVEYRVGTMIEMPRACIVADEIAQEAEFFSFGTNDLTQTTYGFSRDDINQFLPHYLGEGLLKQDPFAVLDQQGVGELVKMGIAEGTRHASGYADRHLRRARRRAGFRGILRQERIQLRFLLALPGAHGPPGGRPGRRRRSPEGRGRTYQVT